MSPALVRPAQNGTMSLIREAAGHGHNGELLLRCCGSRQGRVFLLGKQVAWAYADGSSRHLVDRLLGREALSRRQLAQVVARCREEELNVGEELVGAGLIEPAELREVLRTHIRQELRTIAGFSGLVTALFIPNSRRYAGRFLFDPDEVLPSREERESDRGTLDALEELARGAHEELDQCVAVGLFDAVSQNYVLWFSEALDQSTRGRITRLAEQRTAPNRQPAGYTENLSWTTQGEVAFERVCPESAKRLLIVARDPQVGRVLAHARRVGAGYFD